MTAKMEITSNIVSIRALEDAIRSTRKYTEGIETIHKAHPSSQPVPMQGGDFPSRVFCKYYEVYPNTEISWDMPVGVALDLMWRDVLVIDVLFKYDYRVNRASMIVKDGNTAVETLSKTIPWFGKAMDTAMAKDAVVPLPESEHKGVRVVSQAVRIARS